MNSFPCLSRQNPGGAKDGRALQKVTRFESHTLEGLQKYALPAYFNTMRQEQEVQMEKDALAMLQGSTLEKELSVLFRYRLGGGHVHAVWLRRPNERATYAR